MTESPTPPPVDDRDLLALLSDMLIDRTVRLRFSDAAIERIERHRDRLAALPAAGEADWVLVPREPTPELLQAIIDESPSKWGNGDEFTVQDAVDTYRVILAQSCLSAPAAPVSEAKGASGEGEAERRAYMVNAYLGCTAQRGGAAPVSEAGVLTPSMLADAFGCFWNAALGCDSVRHDSTATATVGGMAQGFAAIEARLRELAHPPAAKAEGADTSEDSELCAAMLAAAPVAAPQGDAVSPAVQRAWDSLNALILTATPEQFDLCIQAKSDIAAALTAKFSTALTPQGGGAVRGLVGHWRQRADNLQGDGHWIGEAYAICADELEAALSLPDTAGAK